MMRQSERVARGMAGTASRAALGSSRGGRRYRNAAVALVAAVILSACAADPKPVDLSQYMVPADTQRAHRAPAPDLHRDVQLIGMEANSVVALLGRPTLTSRENGAQYWRYSYAGCTVDIYVYHDPARARDEGVHVALREPWGDAWSASGRGCARLAARLGALPAETVEEPAAPLPRVQAH